jgi:hypothetical protein
MLNGASGTMVKDIKLEIKAKNFNKKDSFEHFNALNALFPRIYYHFCIVNHCPGAPFSIYAIL